MKFDVIQIGSHIGNTPNDHLFNRIQCNKKIIFIEPIEEYYNQLIINYNEKYPNNEFIFLNVACSDKVGFIELYVPIVTNNSPSWANQLSSVLPNHVKNHNLNIDIDKKIVKTIRLDNLINEYHISEIDLLCVDTEGHDYEILNDFDFKIKPKEIIFEHKHIEDTNHSFGIKYHNLINKLDNLGYELINQIGDDTYIRLKNG